MRTLRSENNAIDRFVHGPWNVDYHLNDGGRLTRIAYKDYDLLTRAPSEFRPPQKDHGQFENRPVYGYDDCFPSVVSCFFPEKRISIPDHGELCWLPWEIQEEQNALLFTVESKLLPFKFKRRMLFTDSAIVWNFEVGNDGDERLPFQHSMHPLVRADEIKSVSLPCFDSVFDWNRNRPTDAMNSGNLRDFLVKSKKGAVEMLFVRGIKSGELSWTYRTGLTVRMKFPSELFPTLGIWWDKGGYPDEKGIARNECAFEPTPGSTSLLSQAYADGECLFVGPGEKFQWQITWEVDAP